MQHPCDRKDCGQCHQSVCQFILLWAVHKRGLKMVSPMTRLESTCVGEAGDQKVWSVGSKCQRSKRSVSPKLNNGTKIENDIVCA